MTDIETLIKNIEKVKNTGAEIQVNFQVRDEGKQENYSIDVGPSDFRATIKFSDFQDLNTKLEAYEQALTNARTKGYVAPIKMPKEK